MMDEALEEHHVAKILIGELREMSPGDERFDAKFKVLAEAVKHHIEEEESELLPNAEDMELDLEALGEELADEMRIRADAGRAVAQLARISFRIAHQLGHGSHGHRRTGVSRTPRREVMTVRVVRTR